MLFVLKGYKMVFVSLIKAFIFGGLICGLSELIISKFKLLPIHITCGLVVVGGALESYGIYDKFLDIFGCGAMIPISSFGHSLVHAAIEKSKETGFLGVFKGVFDMVAPGISFSILIAFVLSLFFKPRS